MSLEDVDGGAPLDESIDEELEAPEVVRQQNLAEEVMDQLEQASKKQEEESPEEGVVELTEEERSQFRTVLTIGRMRRRIFVFDHPFDICTPNIDEELAIGLFTSKYRETDFAMRAYQTAVAAAAIEKVDNKPLYVPLTEETDTEVLFNEKMKIVLKWHSSIVREVYEGVISLESRFAEVVNTLGRLGKTTG